MYAKILEQLKTELKGYFDRHGKRHAVIGISGGKDSTVTAALCVSVLGASNVTGVYLPVMAEPGYGPDKLPDEIREVAEAAGLVNMAQMEIGPMFDYARTQVARKILPLTKQATINALPRLRMQMLYMVAQTLQDALVMNTSNLDERIVGYGTVWGDLCGDFAPLEWLHVCEVRAMGMLLGLPRHLVHKTPDDGLSGVPDEVNLGFTYDDVRDYFDQFMDAVLAGGSRITRQQGLSRLYMYTMAHKHDSDEGAAGRIAGRVRANAFKLEEIRLNGPCEWLGKYNEASEVDHG